MDERDPLLSQAYREAEHPEPPAALDARILAAAREAVTANPPRRRPWFAWAVPLSTTAVLVVAVSLLLKEYREAPETVLDQNPARTTRPQAAAPALKPPGEAATQTSRTQVSGVLSANGQKNGQRAASRPSSPAPASPGNTISAPPTQTATQVQPFPAPAAAEPREAERKQVPFPAATPDFAESAAGTGRTSAAADQAPAGAGVPAQPQTMNIEQRKATTPMDDGLRQMLEEIRRLLREGRENEARGILDALRKRYPDYPLPDDLRGLR